MIHHDLLHVFFFAIHHDSSSLAYSIPILGMGSVPKKHRRTTGRVEIRRRLRRRRIFAVVPVEKKSDDPGCRGPSGPTIG
jgi:hypothetical protein